MRILIPVLLLGLLFPLPTDAADTYPIFETLNLQLQLPHGWQAATTPPASLVAETAEHLGHEAAASGKNPSTEQLDQLARKRLAANELIVFTPASRANLTIDFSPLEEDESAPSAATIEKSSVYAAEGMKEEEGASGVDYSHRPIKLPGAELAHRFDLHYRHHDEPIDFVGIVGYTARSWFFFYFANPGAGAGDRQAYEKILNSLRIEHR